MTLYVLVGLQASGKTSFASTVLRNAVRVSKDDFPCARRRQARQLRLIEEALGAGRDVVVDNTNPSAAEWLPLLDVGHAAGHRVIAYWFPPDVTAAHARNAARPADLRVPDVGFFATLARLRRPTCAAGFDGVRTVRFDGRSGFADERDGEPDDEEPQPAD
jgi:predicted kinase